MKTANPLLAHMLDSTKDRIGDAAELTVAQMTKAFWSAFGQYPSTASALTHTVWKDGIDIDKLSAPTVAFVRAIVAADRALCQPAPIAAQAEQRKPDFRQTPYGPAQSLKSLMAEEAAEAVRVDMPVVAWQARYMTKGKFAVYTTSKYELAVENDQDGAPKKLVYLDHALAALAQKDGEIEAHQDMYCRLADAAGYHSGKDGMEFSPEEWMESLRKDAERYCYLRDCNSGSIVIIQITGMGDDDQIVLTEADADFAIDAALSATPPKE
jgi:hypothetical protein